MNSNKFESAVYSFSYIFIFVMMQIVVMFAAVIASTAFKSGSAIKDLDIYIVTAIADILSVGMIFLIIRLRRRQVKDFADFSKVRLTPLIMAVLGGFAFSGATNILLSLLSNSAVFKTYMDTYSQQFSALDLKNNLIIQGLSIWLLIPICEELVFRGFLFKELRSFITPKYANIIQAALFGLIHFNPVQSFYTFIIGLFFGYAYQKTGRIIVPILMHVVFNIMGTSMSYVSNDNTVLILTLAGIPLGIISLVYFMKTNRNDEVVKNEHYT